MFLKRKMNDSTTSYSDKILQIKEKIEEAEAVVIGAGAGFSTSAGFVYNGERFEKYFSDFRKKYGFSDMYSGGFYPYKTLEKHWGYCYANVNPVLVKENMRKHNPDSPFLIGGYMPGDIVCEAIQKSWIDRQIRLEF